MASRSGPHTNIRTAATYAANATWYSTTAFRMGPGANSILLYATVGTASAGNIEFYLQHCQTAAGTYFDLCSGGESPQVFGPITVAGADTRSLIIRGLPPLEYVQVYFRCSAGAASATLGLTALSFFDEAGSVSAEMLGDIQIDMAALEALVTAGNVDLAAIETLITAGNVDLAALETLVTAGNVDLAAIEVLLGTIDADTSAVHVAALPTEGTTVDVDFDASVASAAAVTAGGVELCATEDCYYVWGAAPVATTAAPSKFLPAGVIQRVTSPGTKIAAIKRNVAGKLSITPLT